MKMIILKCEQCQAEIERNLSQHNANIKKGHRVFCSRKCNGIYSKINLGIPDLSKYKNQQRKADIYSPFRYLISQIKNRSKDRGYEMDLTPEYLYKLWENQKGVCPYSGVSMSFFNQDKKCRIRGGTPEQISVDRIDSQKGYTEGNVELVCLSVNYAKNTFSREQMVNFFKNVKV